MSSAEYERYMRNEGYTFIRCDSEGVPEQHGKYWKIRDDLFPMLVAEQSIDAPSEQLLKTLILEKIEAQSEGLSTRDIRVWLNSVDSPRRRGKIVNYEASGTVPVTLSKMKSEGLIERRDGKWFRQLDSESTRH
jgi:hypothetical protein